MQKQISIVTLALGACLALGLGGCDNHNQDGASNPNVEHAKAEAKTETQATVNAVEDAAGHAGQAIKNGAVVVEDQSKKFADKTEASAQAGVQKTKELAEDAKVKGEEVAHDVSNKTDSTVHSGSSSSAPSQP